MQFKIQKHNLINFTDLREGLVKISFRGGIGVMLIASLNITLIVITKRSIFGKTIIEE